MLPLLCLAIALALALLAGPGGLDPRSAATVEIGAAVAMAAAAVLWLRRRSAPPLGAAAGTAAAALGLYALLALSSESWSLSPLASRQDALRTATYAVVVVLGAAAAGLVARPARAVLILVGGLAAAECALAISERSFARETFGLTGRLQGNLGNANSLAILGAVTVIAGLALAVRAPMLGLALAGLGTFTAFATSSRAAAAGALVASAILALTVDRRPLRRLARPAALLPAAALGVFVSTWDVFDASPGRVRAAGVGLLLCGLAAIAATPFAAVGAGRAARAVAAGRRVATERAVFAVTGGSLAAVVIAVATRNESGRPAIAGFGHLLSSSSNFRSRWWGNALDAWETAPWRGTGAGTFRIVETLARDPAHATSSPHNAVIAALHGVGLVGGIAVVVAGAALVVALVRGARLSSEQVAAPALALAAVTVLAQGLVDVTWETPTLATMICVAAGVLDPATRSSSRVTASLRAGVTAATVLVAVLVAIGGARSAAGIERALDATRAPSPARALALAGEALRLEPRSADAHVAAAGALTDLGSNRAAAVELIAALRLEPANYNAWLAIARLQAGPFGDPAGAVVTFRRGYVASGSRPQVREELNEAEARVGLPPTP